MNSVGWSTTGRRAVAIAAAPVVLALSGCASALLLHPHGPSGLAPGLERRTVSRDAGDLEIWIARSAGAEHAAPEAFVLAFAGNADRAERVAAEAARLFGDRNVEVWGMNYPGFGGSAGAPRLGDIPGAALAAHDALRAHARGVPILCWGESIGSTAALAVAAQREVDGVVLRNPPPLRRLILVRHGWWNLWLAAVPIALQIPDELNSLSTAPAVTAPAVFVMSRGDRVVPYAYQQDVFTAFGGPKEEVTLAGGHNDGTDAGQALRVRAALTRLLDRIR